MHHPELVLDRPALHVVQVEPPAVEIPRVGVVQPHRGVDHLQTRVDRVLRERHRPREVRELGIRLPRQLGRVAEELLVDATARAVLGVRTPHHDEVAVAEIRQRRVVLLVGGGRVHPPAAVHGVARRVVLAQPGLVVERRARALVTVAEERHHEPAGRQRRHRHVVLVARGELVDDELAARLRAVGVEQLPDHRPAIAVLTVRRPHHHELAVRQHRHLRHVVLVALGLLPAGGRVDQERVRERAARRVVAAAEHAAAVAVVAALVGPHDHQVAVGVGRHVGEVLVAGLRIGRTRDVAHPQLAGHRVARVVVAAQDHVVAAAARVAVRRPHHREAAVVPDHRVVHLAVRRRHVGAELPALRHPGRVVALPVDAITRAVVAVVLPGDDEAAVRQLRHVRPALLARRQRVHPPLRAHRHAARAEALRVDPVTTAVLSGRVPRHHVAAVEQRRHRRRRLVAHRVRVNLRLPVGQRRTVELGRDVDAQRVARRGAAVAVRDADADGAAGLRAARGVGVGEVLDQRFHRLHRGVGVERDGEARAVRAAAQGADRRAAVGDGIARHADLPGGRALVAHAELVLGAAELRVEELELAAAEVRRVEVGEAHRRVEHLRRGIDEVLGKGDGAAEVGEHGIRLARQLGRVAEDALEHAGLAAVLVVGAPDHHVVVAAEVGERRLVLDRLAGRGLVGLDLAAQGRAVGRVLAHVHVVEAARAAHVVVVVVPRDHEPAVGEPDHVRLVLAAGRGDVDAELAARLRAVGVEALSEHARAAAVLAVRAPDDHEAAAGEHRHVRLVLRPRRERVDQDRTAQRRSCRVVALRVNAIGAAVSTVLVRPDHHMAAVGPRRHVRLVLGARGRAVDAQLAAHRHAGIRVALRVDVVAAAARVAVRRPRHHEAAAVGRHARLVLRAVGDRVDAELDALRDAGGVVALGVDAGATAVAGTVRPDHHVTAARERGHLRVVLIVGRRGVDAVLGAERHADAAEALCVHARAAAVLVVGAPHDDVRTVGQRGYGRLVLVARGEGVDPRLREHGIRRQGTVEGLGRRHLPGHRAHAARTGLHGRCEGDRRPAAGNGGHAVGVRALQQDLDSAVERGDRLPGGGVRARCDGGLHLAARRLGRRVERAHVGCGRTGPVAAVEPAHHEAAVRQRRHFRLVLHAVQRLVDLELVPRRRVVGTEALRPHARALARRAVGQPRHHEAAVGERGDRRLLLLGAADLPVDPDQGAGQPVLPAEALGIHPDPEVVVQVGALDGHVTAVRKGCHVSKLGRVGEESLGAGLLEHEDHG